MKVRQTLIGGNRKMIVHDDMEPTEKIKICDKGVTVSESSEKEHQMRIGRRAGDMWAPHIPNRKAVQTEVEQFVACLRDGHAGVRVIKMRDAASQSAAQLGGRPTSLG